MTLKPAIKSHLEDDTDVTDLVSTRIRVNRSEQSDADSARIVIDVISADHKHHMTAATGKVIYRVQLNCYGTSPKNAATIAEKVRLRMDGFRGAMGSGFASMCHLVDERDQDTPPVSGHDRGTHGIQQDYLIGWGVPVPTFA